MPPAPVSPKTKSPVKTQNGSSDFTELSELYTFSLSPVFSYDKDNGLPAHNLQRLMAGILMEKQQKTHTQSKNRIMKRTMFF